MLMRVRGMRAAYSLTFLSASTLSNLDGWLWAMGGSDPAAKHDPATLGLWSYRFGSLRGCCERALAAFGSVCDAWPSDPAAAAIGGAQVSGEPDGAPVSGDVVLSAAGVGAAGVGAAGMGSRGAAGAAGDAGHRCASGCGDLTPPRTEASVAWPSSASGASSAAARAWSSAASASSRARSCSRRCR